MEEAYTASALGEKLSLNATRSFMCLFARLATMLWPRIILDYRKGTSEEYRVRLQHLDARGQIPDAFMGQHPSATVMPQKQMIPVKAENTIGTNSIGLLREANWLFNC